MPIPTDFEQKCHHQQQKNEQEFLYLLSDVSICHELFHQCLFTLFLGQSATVKVCTFVNHCTHLSEKMLKVEGKKMISNLCQSLKKYFKFKQRKTNYKYIKFVYIFQGGKKNPLAHGKIKLTIRQLQFSAAFEQTGVHFLTQGKI